MGRYTTCYNRSKPAAPVQSLLAEDRPGAPNFLVAFDVRFRGYSGHAERAAQCLLLTQSGHSL